MGQNNDANANSTTVMAITTPTVTRKYLRAFFFLVSSRFANPVIRYQKVNANPIRIVIAFVTDPIVKRKDFMLFKIRKNGESKVVKYAISFPFGFGYGQ